MQEQKLPDTTIQPEINPTNTPEMSADTPTNTPQPDVNHPVAETPVSSTGTNSLLSTIMIVATSLGVVCAFIGGLLYWKYKRRRY
jgi:hypothetical protein